MYREKTKIELNDTLMVVLLSEQDKLVSGKAAQKVTKMIESVNASIHFMKIKCLYQQHQKITIN